MEWHMLHWRRLPSIYTSTHQYLGCRLGKAEILLKCFTVFFLLNNGRLAQIEKGKPLLISSYIKYQIMWARHLVPIQLAECSSCPCRVPSSYLPNRFFFADSRMSDGNNKFHVKLSSTFPPPFINCLFNVSVFLCKQAKEMNGKWPNWWIIFINQIEMDGGAREWVPHS